ncbi:MAG: hypothetical protein KDC98_19000 [Planctomycetes bacterium]|nr:hypothetical protein [Planctomycetota bacterium]
MNAIATAKERQLDWLLGEVLGDVVATRARRIASAAATAGSHRWPTAAMVLLAVAAAVGVAWLRQGDDGQATVSPASQLPQSELEWHEIMNASQLDTLPIDAQNVRCFDFDDAAVARLARFTAIERLDLGGMAVNDKGYAVALPITDAALTTIAGLPRLRWLSLKGCEQVKGTGLVELEKLARLEHLDLTHTAIDSPALERLQRLPALRELLLSWCMQFHGRSLAAVAGIPGLRRLELRGCTTLRAADVAHLAKLHELRHLDLRDCQGRFRGQTLVLDGEEPDDPPPQDGIGITAASIAALSGLQLETLLLGGSESLTDAVGDTLARMTTLRDLDLSGLPKITPALLPKLPTGLTSLALDNCAGLYRAATAAAEPTPLRLPTLPALRELAMLGANGHELSFALAGRRLTSLRIGTMIGLRNPEAMRRGSDKVGAAIAAQPDLTRLTVVDSTGDWRHFLSDVTTLDRLRELTLTVLHAGRTELERLDECTGVEALRLVNCRRFDQAVLDDLAGLPLRELTFRGTDVPAERIRALAGSWPGCEITLTNGHRFRVPKAR